MLLAQVLEEAPALADQHQQAPAGVVVLLVGLEVVGQPVDPLRQERDLNLGGPGIAFVDPELLDEVLLLPIGRSHAAVLLGAPPPIATSPGLRLPPPRTGSCEPAPCTVTPARISQSAESATSGPAGLHWL